MRNIFVISGVLLIIILIVVNRNILKRIPKAILNEKEMFWDLVRNDFQARFAGSYFGAIWAFVQPIVTMLLYLFVFQVGLRAGNVSNYPFILFLMSGLIPWFYFSEALSGATTVLNEYSYLVKKVVFDVEILPVIKVLSALFVHVFFVVFIIIICTLYGFVPGAYTVQLLYYIFCMIVLVTGFSYITSACNAFFKDITQIVAIILTIGTWATPIMWNAEAVISGLLLIIFKLNPMYYVVDGFRDALLAQRWFWDKPYWTLYYWAVCLVIYIIGVKMYSRLKIHFSDVI